VYRLLKSHGPIVAAMSGLPVVLALFICFHLVNTVRGAWNGDLISFLTVLVIVQFTLVAALAFGFMAFAMRTDEREESRDKQAPAARIQASRALSDLRNEVSRLATEIRANMPKPNGATIDAINTIDWWCGQAPGSVYTAVNQQYRYDLVDDFGSNGELIQLADKDRIRRIYLSRLDRYSGVARYRMIIFVKESLVQGGKMPPQIKSLLTLVRAIRAEAVATKSDVDLGRILVFPRIARECNVSFFTGTKIADGGTVPFAIKYVSVGSTWSLARVLLDDRLTIFLDARDVDDLNRTADALCFGIRPLTIREIELMYGISAEPAAPGVPQQDLVDDGSIVVSGDHFVFR
jgi:hypothetical protein